MMHTHKRGLGLCQIMSVGEWGPHIASSRIHKDDDETRIRENLWNWKTERERAENVPHFRFLLWRIPQKTFGASSFVMGGQSCEGEVDCDSVYG